ncbi:hypothetical protein AGLY_002251 [Aphis glycines]|uniref:Activating transcription factor 7-interacting protein Fn3 domain-containing protein n=1 Tax=Aphis glycines TaxID=307491 RepID=A0A6G0U2V6_APHGL|nr:hypothetical protein AGLY_002251 [Aphis glycines]
MNENKMNNDKAGEINDQEQDPQIFIKLDDNEVIQFPLSKFNYILDRQITEYLNEANNENIINPKDYKAKKLDSIVKQLEKDLMKDKFAQSQRFRFFNFGQNVDLSFNQTNGGIFCENSIKDREIFTVSLNSEDQSCIITDSSKTKLITLTKNDNTNLINSESDNNSKKLNVKYKPCPKSKKKFSKHNVKVKVKGANKAMPLNTELDQNNLTTVKCLSTIKCKRKPGPKSKTMIVDNMIFSYSNNKEPDENKMCLNKEVTENYNFCLKFSSSKYPPPYPLIPPHNTQPSWKNIPSIPKMSIKVSRNKVTLKWNLNLFWKKAEIKMYELFVCQETDAYPDVSMWKKKDNIKAKKLPMTCELEEYELGYIYYFALRAVDVHNRRVLLLYKKLRFRLTIRTNNLMLRIYFSIFIILKIINLLLNLFHCRPLSIDIYYYNLNI